MAQSTTGAATSIAHARVLHHIPQRANLNPHHIHPINASIQKNSKEEEDDHVTLIDMAHHKHRFGENCIPILINSYSDLFSNFDVRHLAVRDISLDFVEECAKKLKQTPHGRLYLNILIDNAKRVSSEEKIVKDRLKEFFQSQKRSTRLELFCWYMWGFAWIFFGFFVMTIVAYFNYYYNDNQSNVAYHMFNNVAAPIGKLSRLLWQN